MTALDKGQVDEVEESGLFRRARRGNAGASFHGLVGDSHPMRSLFQRIERVSRSDAAVLITGETGTGKEMVARAVHQGSRRAGKPFIVVDCASLPRNLVESELFGHARGAFTDANSDRAGAFELADGGTLFLDELGEVPLELQTRLLRAIETGMVRRVGEGTYRQVDVRILCATHRDLRAMSADGHFRWDLYYRIAVLPVDVPPLRERMEDLPQLVRHFLGSDKGEAEDLVLELLRELDGRTWPGNVRELRNVVIRAAALGVRDAMQLGPTPTSATSLDVPLDEPLKEVRQRWADHVERRYLEGMLSRYGRSLKNIGEAAGIDPSSVHRLLRKHRL